MNGINNKFPFVETLQNSLENKPGRLHIGADPVDKGRKEQERSYFKSVPFRYLATGLI